MVYDVPFWRILEDLEQSSEDICKHVHGATGYRPYNTRLVVKLSNSEPTQLGLQDMAHFMKLPFALTDIGAAGHMFGFTFNSRNDMTC